jgi:hypothetical protein
MGLDIGNFIRDTNRENKIRGDNANRCRTCGRDKRLNSRRTELPTTEVKQRCPECRAPLLWLKTNHSGDREEHEWLIQDKREVIRKGKKGRGFRVEFD